MSREEVQKLLGGYATGTLTAEEQQALFEAALDDQELFDTLAREQGLRDLLRDPSAKAELLAALDERPARGLLAWLRRPTIAGLAMAGVAAIAVVVWQSSRRPAQPLLIAENKPQEAPRMAQPVAPAPAPTPAAASPMATARVREAEAPTGVPEAKVVKEEDRRTFRPLTPEPLRDKDLKQRLDASTEAPVVAQAKPAEINLSQPTQSNLGVQQAAPPAPMNQMMQNQANVQNQANLQTQTGQRMENARALFYGTQAPTGGRAAFTDSVAPASRAKADKRAAQGAFAGAIGGVAGVPGMARLGVRCSIVRDGNREVDLSTPLYAGESVKLRLTPNADGMLSVYEGEGAAAHVVASGAVRNMVPFETPVLKSDTPGPRQFRVTLTSGAMAKTAAAQFGAVSRANLVESTSDKESATYVVLGDAIAGSAGFAATITLTWR